MSTPARSNDDISGNDGLARRVRRRPGENRERLLEAGIIVFSAYGYHGASTAAVAAVAEVPQLHVYANFHTKQELFLDCMRKVIGDLMSASNGGLSAKTTTTTVHADFLLQCLAASREQLLQPELGELLHELSDNLGLTALTELISESISSALTRL